MKIFLILILIFTIPFICFSQENYPKSLNVHNDVNIFSYDNIQHRSQEHYTKLYHILLSEYNIRDTIPIILIFIDTSIIKKITNLNPTRFDFEYWQGYYMNNSNVIIMNGNFEGDDTFFHEVMHLLYHARKLFVNIFPTRLHDHIIYNEALMVVSKGYVDYIKGLR